MYFTTYELHTLTSTYLVLFLSLDLSLIASSLRCMPLIQLSWAKYVILQSKGKEGWFHEPVAPMDFEKHWFCTHRLESSKVQKPLQLLFDHFSLLNTFLNVLAHLAFLWTLKNNQKFEISVFTFSHAAGVYIPFKDGHASPHFKVCRARLCFSVIF